MERAIDSMTYDLNKAGKEQLIVVEQDTFIYNIEPLTGLARTVYARVADTLLLVELVEIAEYTLGSDQLYLEASFPVNDYSELVVKEFYEQPNETVSYPVSDLMRQVTVGMLKEDQRNVVSELIRIYGTIENRVMKFNLNASNEGDLVFPSPKEDGMYYYSNGKWEIRTGEDWEAIVAGYLVELEEAKNMHIAEMEENRDNNIIAQQEDRNANLLLQENDKDENILQQEFNRDENIAQQESNRDANIIAQEINRDDNIADQIADRNQNILLQQADRDENIIVVRQELEDLVQEAVRDNGALPEGTTLTDLTIQQGFWTIEDLTKMFDIPDVGSDSENIGILEVNEADKDIVNGIAGSRIVKYSTTDNIYFNVYTKGNIWGGWKVLSSEGGLSFVVHEPNHGYILTPVIINHQETPSTPPTSPAPSNLGADGLAIRLDEETYLCVLKGLFTMPDGVVDDLGNELVDGEYYFLSQSVDGHFQRSKPTTGIFQPLFGVGVTNERRMVHVAYEAPIDITPRVIAPDGSESSLVTRRNVREIIDEEGVAKKGEANVFTKNQTIKSNYGKVMFVDGSDVPMGNIGQTPDFIEMVNALTGKRLELNSLGDLFYNGNIVAKNDTDFTSIILNLDSDAPYIEFLGADNTQLGIIQFSNGSLTVWNANSGGLLTISNNVLTFNGEIRATGDIKAFYSTARMSRMMALEEEDPNIKIVLGEEYDKDREILTKQLADKDKKLEEALRAIKVLERKVGDGIGKSVNTNWASSLFRHKRGVR